MTSREGERMDRPRNRWKLRVAVVLVVGLGMLIWAIRQQSQNALTISNQSGQAITQLHVTAGTNDTTVRDIPPGGDVEVKFITRADAPFRLQITLADGSLHFWSGRANSLKLLVLPDGNIQPAAEKR
jgi:hypothetical protein